MDLVQNLIKIKKLSMDLVHVRGSMDPVHESGPWTRSKEGAHGPLVHVLSSPGSSEVLVVVQFYPWFNFYFLLFLGMVICDNEFETNENKN